MRVTSRKIPVFVFPTSLKFYLTSKPSHKQLLSLYNPYNFAVTFQVRCTAPSKYTIIEPDGYILPHSSVDIIIRHIMPSTLNCGVVDKFMITMADRQTKQPMEPTIVDAILLDCDRDSTSDDGDYHASYRSESHAYRGTSSLTTSPSNTYLILVIGLIAVVILCFPTSPESIEIPNPNIPKYLHMSLQIKLFCSFILGIITLILIKGI